MTPAFFKVRKGQIHYIGILGFQVPVCFCCCQRLLGQSRNDRLSGDHKAGSSPRQSRQHQGAKLPQTARPCALSSGLLEDAGGLEIRTPSYNTGEMLNISFPPVPFGSSSFDTNILRSKEDLLLRRGQISSFFFIHKNKK